MDEPLSNLDAALRVQMRVELKHLHDRLSVTTVYVTHDQVEAMTMGDRIAIMNDGRLQQADTPEAIYVRPANLFVAGFIGSPKMNLVHGRVSSAGRACRGRLPRQDRRNSRARSRMPSRRSITGEVVVGLRAEDLRLVSDAPATYSTQLQGVVDVWEPLGSETYVVVKIARARADSALPAAHRGGLGRRRRRRSDPDASPCLRRAHRAERARGLARRPGAAGRRSRGCGTRLTKPGLRASYR